jgi:hypothetical protein
MANKKMVKRRNTRRRTRKVKPLPLGGFPKQKVVRLRYVQELAIITPGTTGLSKSLPFVANGCYDPYYPIGGHQPKGFDQWMAIYSHYNVLGSKITAKCASTGGYSKLAWGVCRTPASTEMNGKTLEYILENRYQKNARYIAANNNQNVNLNNTPLIAKYSQKAEYGSNATSQANLVGDITTNPNDKTFYEVWACPLAGDTQSKELNMVIVIDYLVLLTEPKILGQS